MPPITMLLPTPRPDIPETVFRNTHVLTQLVRFQQPPVGSTENVLPDWTCNKCTSARRLHLGTYIWTVEGTTDWKRGGHWVFWHKTI